MKDKKLVKVVFFLLLEVVGDLNEVLCGFVGFVMYKRIGFGSF